ncbi:sugar-binding protein [Paenibacillus oryzisoli]|uniref:sugar-binding protein n=1 Tax=Paenibacillus oryzisoli TaxID=1850517 RepID=UPI003D298D88
MRRGNGKWLMAVWAIALLVSLCVPGGMVGHAHAEEAASLLANGGFESGTWPLKTGAVLDTATKHSGSQSAGMSGTATSQYMGSGLIPVQATAVYDLTAWMKTAGVSTSEAASVNVLMIGDSNNSLGWYSGAMKLIRAGGDQDWTKYQVELSAFAPGTAYIRVYVRLDANVTGTVWFDDLAVQTSSNTLANGGFESGLWAMKKGSIWADTAVRHSGNTSVGMTEATEGQYAGSGLIPVHDNDVYELSAWVKTAALSSSDGASVNVLLADANMDSLGWYNNAMKLIGTGGTQDWTQYAAELAHLLPGTAYIRIYVRLDANVAGTVWFDDLIFKPKELVIGTDGPVGNIIAADNPASLDLTLKNNAAQDKDVHVTYSLTDADHQTVAGESFDAHVTAGSTYQSSVNLSALNRYGQYTLSVVAQEAGKAAISEDFPFSRVDSPAAPATDNMFGTALHLMGKTDANLVDTYLSQVADTGIKWIRDDARWEKAETTAGQIGIPASWDLFVDTALSKGLHPILIIDYGNPLYDGGKAPYTDEGIAAYANYAGELAEHFAGKVDHFEIWNEWNIGGGNPDRLSAEAYAKVLKAAYSAIKAANPDAFVISCATSGADAEWIGSVLAAGGYGYMDAVSIHPYTYPVNPDDGGLAASLTAIHNLFAAYGPAKPVWVTEIGWPTSEVLDRGVSERVSGAYAARAYTLALSSGIAEKVFWYDFKNDYKPDTSLEGQFGLVRGDHESVPWSAKQNYIAYRAAVSRLSGAAYVQSYDPGDRVQAYRFHRSYDGKDVIVVWSQGDAKQLLMQLGVSTATAYDLYGNQTALSAGTDGTMMLPVSEEPVYVEGEFAQTISIKDPYSLDVYPQLTTTPQGDQWAAEIRIRNQLDIAQSGTVQMTGSGPWQQGSGPQAFTVMPNSTTTVTYLFTGEPEPVLYDLDIRTIQNNGSDTVVKRKLSFMAAEQTDQPPVIDGMMSAGEWAGARPITIDQASQSHITDWGGTSDLSATGYLQWDADHLYLAVSVQDNVYAQSGTGSDIWKGDGIQFAIDPGRKLGSSALGYNEIGLALNSDTSNVILWRWKAPAGAGGLNNVQRAVQRNAVSSTTVYEMAIPWTALLPAGMTPTAGTDLGFSLLINDNDGAGRRGWMEYMGGIGASKDPKAFGDLLLVLPESCTGN